MFPFITVFLNKFLDNKPKGFIIDDRDDIDDSDDIDVSDDIDRDLDTELELLTRMNALTMEYDARNRPILYHPSIRISKSNVSLHNMDSKHSRSGCE